MSTEKITYQIDGTSFQGYWSFPEKSESKKLPAVIVVHAWMGQDDFARKKADDLAKLGYIAFAVDLYGEGKTATNSGEAEALMRPLFMDRALLRKRICGALEVVAKHPLVDSSSIGAIGFCFGGLTVIELFRSGANVKAAVTFHAVLGSKMGSMQAKEVSIAQSIKGSILVLHGHDDPLVSSDDIRHFQDEFTKAKVDWQMNIYSQTSHAFTNPAMHGQATGLRYQPLSAKRAWDAMVYFFQEKFT